MFACVLVITLFNNNMIYGQPPIHTCSGMTNARCMEFSSNEYGLNFQDIHEMSPLMRLITEERLSCKLDEECSKTSSTQSIFNQRTNCVNNKADKYSCSNIDLLSFIPLRDLGSGKGKIDGNDIWGWVNEIDGTNYVITGQEDGATIVDVTNPLIPEILCFIPSAVNTKVIWRDIKIVTGANDIEFAVIVADNTGHGMQYIPLIETINECRSSNERPYIVSAIGRDTTVFSSVTQANAHNIVQSESDINPNRIYLVGSRTDNGGLICVDFSEVSGIDPETDGIPIKKSSYVDDGYVHDAQCFTYKGPDTNYFGKDICITYGGHRIVIIDYTDETSPIFISRYIYPESQYIHQGWINNDHTYLLMNDELDEYYGTVNSQTTYIIDITDLSNPILASYETNVNSIDHNLYTKQFSTGEYVFETNYEAGLRVFGIDNIQNSQLNVKGYFDTYPKSDSVNFNGAWSNYVYLNVPNYPALVAVQDINSGLFILDACNAVGIPCN